MSERRVSRQHRQRGMTLLEVMIAMAILGMMMALAWGTISGTSNAKRDAEAIQERNREIRIGMGRMVRDLSHAFLSANEDQGMLERRTLLVGKESTSVGELRFSSLGHVPLWADADESEQTLISYYSETDPDDASRTNLLRRESRRLSNENWKNEKAEVDLLIPDVETVKFEFWDFKDKEWKSSWDTTGGDSQHGRLPTRVRITVEIDDGGTKVEHTTQARLMLQEQLQFFTN
jgi:prepilin-type N-terminal cleavage/methylation domain-containing protein